MAKSRWMHALLLVTLGADDRDALAMGIENETTILARAAGGPALVEIRARGPEGGGALTYRVEDKAHREAVDFLVSSDFSPGNGSRPQTVPAKDCEKRLSALGAEIAKRKIPGVTLRPERCQTRSRDGLVVVSPSQ